MLLVSAVLFWKGMQTGRTSYYFPILFFFVFFYAMNRLDVKHLARVSFFSCLIFLFLLEIVFYFNFRYGVNNKWFGAHLDDYMPVEEVQFIKKHRLPGPIFNDYMLGGYLVWALYPEYKVFLDSRSSPYRQQVFPDFMEFTLKPITQESLEKFHRKYPFKTVILLYRQMSVISGFLKMADEWPLVYFGRNAAVFVHKSVFSFYRPALSGVNLGLDRFQGEKDPRTLLNVFNFCVRLKSEYGRYILNIYKNNVSDCYLPKEEDIELMNFIISSKEAKDKGRASKPLIHPGIIW